MIPRLGKYSVTGHGNSLSILAKENPMDRHLVGYSPQGPWSQASYTTEQQNTHTTLGFHSSGREGGNKMLPKEQEISRFSDLTSITHTHPKSQLLYTVRMKKKVMSQFSLPEILSSKKFFRKQNFANMVTYLVVPGFDLKFTL